MPLEAGVDTTPMKSNWNRSNMSLNASTSFIEEVGTANSSFLSKSLLEGTKLDALDEEELNRHPDSTILSTSANSSTCEDTSGSSSFLEKSHHSRDSGISSLVDDPDPVFFPASAPALEVLHEKDQAEPDFKISIYSKVSGCRMTNLTDYWIVKQIRVAILQRLTNGDPHLALTYKFGYEKMANGGLQIISDSENLIKMLGSLGYFAGIPCKMTFPDTPRVVGFIKGLPTDLEPSDLKDEIRKTYSEVYSVRYVTEKSRGFAHGMQRPCAFISFNLRYLPKTVQIFDEIFELQVPNPMQCTRCCRYGHQGKQCRAQTRCSFCGGLHQRQVCVAKLPSCINCQGVHTATSHDCLIWVQGKYMNELRYRGNSTKILISIIFNADFS